MNKLIGLLKRLDWTRLTLRERVLFVLTLGVMGVVLVSLLFWPTKQRIELHQVQLQALTSEIKKTQALLPEARDKAFELRQIRQKGEVAGGFLVKASDILPGGSRLSSFLEELTRLARLQRVEFVSVRPEGVEDKGSYLQLTMRIDVQSRFRELGEYLLMLENLPRVIIIDEMKVESSTETTPYVMAHLKATTYMAKE